MKQPGIIGAASQVSDVINHIGCFLCVNVREVAKT